MKLVPAFQNILNLSFSKLKSNDPSRSHRIFEPTDNYSPTTTTRLLLLMNIRLHGFCRNIHSSPRTQTRQTDRLAWKLLSRVRETLHLDLLLLASSSTSLRNCRCAGICRCTLSIRCWFSLSLSPSYQVTPASPSNVSWFPDPWTLWSQSQITCRNRFTLHFDRFSEA